MTTKTTSITDRIKNIAKGAPANGTASAPRSRPLCQVPPALADRVAKVAEALGLSRAGYVTEILMPQLEQHEALLTEAIAESAAMEQADADRAKVESITGATPAPGSKRRKASGSRK